ncbi:hypothetical protein [Alteromonas sp. RKMC-009]|uniref:hypothetical protein n=1 Tax=Alteromonas sp. RKMC-009 TaxID=2267264 RepID=UPI000E67E090|nr:hypothetical protein [Alteromonas sp. RKMC-009]AYA64338.1 hypothetical protein DS731_10190 [Alteromonas sp. RKMC-009]
MIVAGLDPSLSNLGMVKGHFDGVAFDPHELKLVQTSADKSAKKQVRKNSQDLQRCRELHDGLHKFIEGVDLIFVEVPVGSQSARAMMSYGACVQLLAGIKIPLIEVTPNEVKLAATGDKNATKQDMITWAVNKYPNVKWLTQKRNGHQVITAKNEHLADAVAAVEAGMQTDTFKQLLSFHRKIRA